MKKKEEKKSNPTTNVPFHDRHRPHQSTKCSRQQSHPSLLAQDGECGTFLPRLSAVPGGTEGEPTPATKSSRSLVLSLFSLPPPCVKAPFELEVKD